MEINSYYSEDIGGNVIYYSFSNLSFSPNAYPLMSGGEKCIQYAIWLKAMMHDLNSPLGNVQSLLASVYLPKSI